MPDGKSTDFSNIVNSRDIPSGKNKKGLSHPVKPARFLLFSEKTSKKFAYM